MLDELQATVNDFLRLPLSSRLVYVGRADGDACRLGVLDHLLRRQICGLARDEGNFLVGFFSALMSIVTLSVVVNW